MKKETVKKSIICVTAFIVLNLLLFFSIKLIFPVNADTYPDDTPKVNLYSLKVGKYYMYGDTSLSYIEVFDDSTLQHKNFDFEGYLREVRDRQIKEYNIKLDPDKAEIYEKAFNDEIASMSARYEYRIITRNHGDDSSSFVSLGTSDPDAPVGSSHGYTYINEDRIEWSDGMWFEYVE